MVRASGQPSTSEWIKSQQCPCEVSRSQPVAPALNSDYQEPQFGELSIRDFGSNLTRYSCCSPIWKRIRLEGWPSAELNHSVGRRRYTYLYLVFNSEATFHPSGILNKQNVHFWGIENPHASAEFVRDLPKVNMFHALSKAKVYSPFFFTETTVTSIAYLDMVKQWLCPQLKEDFPGHLLFQQYGTPPHFHSTMRAFSIISYPKVG
jgi:hypothetical protein